jgi:hypothetical protein
MPRASGRERGSDPVRRSKSRVEPLPRPGLLREAGPEAPPQLLVLARLLVLAPLPVQPPWRVLLAVPACAQAQAQAQAQATEKVDALRPPLDWPATQEQQFPPVAVAPRWAPVAEPERPPRARRAESPVAPAQTRRRAEPLPPPVVAPATPSPGEQR